MARGAGKKIHFQSLKKVAIARLLKDENERPFFTLRGFCEAIVNDYVAEAANVGHYAKNAPYESMSEKIQAAASVTLREMGFTPSPYKRIQLRIGRYGREIKVDNHVWVRNDWNFPSSRKLGGK